MKMATEAQRLIGISLTKIAQSRAHRGGVSLHKNLLVATVLQKARYIFMEEAYHMVHAGGYCPPPATPPPQHHPPQPEFEQQNYDEDEDESLVALTPEEAGISEDGPGEAALQELLEPACVRCAEDRDKENVPPPSYPHTHQAELTYLDLDKAPSVLRDTTTSNNTTGNTTCLKRRRAVTEWETEEAVLSILPKRSRATITPVAEPESDEGDDSVFLDEAALFSDCVAREAAAAEDAEECRESGGASSAMEIDRITSLVSIFSFGGLGGGDLSSAGKLARSVSTPDLCSAQAKDQDALQQRPFLAMTV